HAEEDHAELGGLHSGHQVLPDRQRHAGVFFYLLRVELDALGQGPQRPQTLEIAAGLDLNEDVGRLGRLGSADIDDDAGAVFAAVNQRVLAPRQNLGRPLAAVGHARRLSIDMARGAVFDLVVEKPSGAQHTGPLGFGDLVPLDGQVDIVAYAAAEGAGGVFD